MDTFNFDFSIEYGENLNKSSYWGKRGLQTDYDGLQTVVLEYGLHKTFLYTVNLNDHKQCQQDWSSRFKMQIEIYAYRHTDMYRI